jgi:hypothetical protein
MRLNEKTIITKKNQFSVFFGLFFPYFAVIFWGLLMMTGLIINFGFIELIFTYDYK